MRITLINPNTQRPYPHTTVEDQDTGEDRVVYSIEDWQSVTVALDLETTSEVELLLAFDGMDGFADSEEDTKQVTPTTVGRVVSQRIYVRGTDWFLADNGAPRGTREMAGTVWAAFFYGRKDGEAWTRSNMPPKVVMVEYDSQAHLLARGIRVPIVSPFDPFDQLELERPKADRGVGRRDCRA